MRAEDAALNEHVTPLCGAEGEDAMDERKEIVPDSISGKNGNEKKQSEIEEKHRNNSEADGVPTSSTSILDKSESDVHRPHPLDNEKHHENLAGRDRSAVS